MGGQDLRESTSSLWFLMLSQALFAILSSFPTDTVTDESDVQRRNFPPFDFVKKNHGQNVVYRTCLVHVQNRHSLFADGARWSSIQFLGGCYTRTSSTWFDCIS